MNSILLLFLIGISLSMDTFSLALSLGTFNITKKIIVSFSLLVALFHFFMPLLGMLLGKSISSFILVNSDRLLFIIFLFIAIEMLIDLCSKEEKSFELNYLNMLIYGFSVSIDSFTVGIGLLNITQSPTIGCLIFSLTSFVFTYVGLMIGKFAYGHLGRISKILGLIIIIFLSFWHLFK